MEYVIVELEYNLGVCELEVLHDPDCLEEVVVPEVLQELLAADLLADVVLVLAVHVQQLEHLQGYY